MYLIKMVLYVATITGFVPVLAQSDAQDWLLWNQIGVDYAAPSGVWGANAAGSLFFDQNASNYWLSFVSANVFSQPFGRHRFSTGYLHGDLESNNRVGLLRLRYFYYFPGKKVQPYVRLSLEKLWIGPYDASKDEVPVNNRLRTLLGVQVSGKTLQYTLFFEPVVKRREGWFRDIRYYAAASFPLWPRWSVSLAYFGRFTSYTGRQEWQHFIAPGLRFHLGPVEHTSTLLEHD